MQNRSLCVRRGVMTASWFNPLETLIIAFDSNCVHDVFFFFFTVFFFFFLFSFLFVLLDYMFIVLKIDSLVQNEFTFGT